MVQARIHSVEAPPVFRRLQLGLLPGFVDVVVRDVDLDVVVVDQRHVRVPSEVLCLRDLEQRPRSSRDLGEVHGVLEVHVSPAERALGVARDHPFLEAALVLLVLAALGLEDVVGFLEADGTQHSFVANMPHLIYISGRNHST